MKETRTTNILLLIIVIPVIFYVLKILSFIFIPLISSMFIALLFLPLMRWLSKKKVPKPISIFIIIIIIVGILLFFRHRPMFSMMWHTMSGNWFNILFAVALIGVGIYILLNRKDGDEKSESKLNLSGLHISGTDKKLAGVCGGIAETINIDSTIIRLIWVLGTLLSAGIGVVLYIVCMLIFNKNDNDEIEVK